MSQVEKAREMFFRAAYDYYYFKKWQKESYTALFHYGRFNGAKDLGGLILSSGELILIERSAEKEAENKAYVIPWSARGLEILEEIEKEIEAQEAV
jgi:hypothetical protein